LKTVVDGVNASDINQPGLRPDRFARERIPMTTHTDRDEVRDYHESVAAILDKVVSNARAHTSNLPG
jgi:hypothetical protein